MDVTSSPQRAQNMNNHLTDYETMPETNAPDMVKINFSVPQPLYEEAITLAEAEGWRPAELFRIFWEKGFAAHAEGSNKRLVNKKLRGENE